MTLLARRARPVYRVYTEADYLQAGADPFADWPAAAVAEPAAGASRERRLRRLAGAAALTGAVGTVGGLLGSALVNGRSTDRLSAGAASRLEASTRAAVKVAAELPSRHVRSAVPRARGAGVGGRVGAGRTESARVRARRVTIANSPGRGRSGDAGRVAAALRDGRMRDATKAASARAASTVGAASAQGASAAPARVSSAAQPAQAADARGEFGFEH